MSSESAVRGGKELQSPVTVQSHGRDVPESSRVIDPGGVHAIGNQTSSIQTVSLTCQLVSIEGR